MKKLIIVSILLLLTSCCTNPLQKPSERVVDTVLPEYIKYVDSDDSLTDSSKQRRKDAIQSYIEAVNSGRN